MQRLSPVGTVKVARRFREMIGKSQVFQIIFEACNAFDGPVRHDYINRPRARLSGFKDR